MFTKFAGYVYRVYRSGQVDRVYRSGRVRERGEVDPPSRSLDMHKIQPWYREGIFGRVLSIFSLSA